jgi:hypothetical protein
LGFVEIPSWPRGASWSPGADWRVGILPRWAPLTRIPPRTVYPGYTIESTRALGTRYGSVRTLGTIWSLITIFPPGASNTCGPRAAIRGSIKIVAAWANGTGITARTSY